MEKQNQHLKSHNLTLGCRDGHKQRKQEVWQGTTARFCSPLSLLPAQSPHRWSETLGWGPAPNLQPLGANLGLIQRSLACCHQ